MFEKVVAPDLEFVFIPMNIYAYLCKFGLKSQRFI